jgi:hypothetical protein
MHLFKLNDGIYIDDKKIQGVTGVEMKSHVGDISEVTLTFLCTVDGLDNIKDNPVAANIQK